MPPRCKACNHPDRAALDTALAEGTSSFRTIADRFGLSGTGLKRHKAEHLPAHLARATAAAEKRLHVAERHRVRGLRATTPAQADDIAEALHNYMLAGESGESPAFVEFFEAVRKADATGAVRNLALIETAAPTHWQAAAWKLERRWGYRAQQEAKAAQPVPSTSAPGMTGA